MWKIEKAKNFDRNYKLVSLILYFFIFSFVGYLIELITFTLKTHMFVNTGILFGPIAPIYGICGLLILMLSRYKSIRRLFQNSFFTFAFTLIFGMIVEYFTSFYIEAITGMNFLNSAGEFLCINSRVSLESGICYAVCGVINIFFVFPIVKKYIIDKVPMKAQIIICLILVGLFAGDIIYTFKNFDVMTSSANILY